MEQVIANKKGIGRVNITEAILTTLFIVLLSALLITMFKQIGTFAISRIVPGFTYAAALAAVLQIRDAYRAGKGLRTALKIGLGWTGVSLLVSVLGDTAIEYLLNNHYQKLANW